MNRNFGIWGCLWTFSNYFFTICPIVPKSAFTSDMTKNESFFPTVLSFASPVLIRSRQIRLIQAGCLEHIPKAEKSKAWPGQRLLATRQWSFLGLPLHFDTSVTYFDTSATIKALIHGSRMLNYFDTSQGSGFTSYPGCHGKKNSAWKSIQTGV